ncbi:MAG: hypothetical protein U5Q44_09610 [Dehalococcoidia bacterium]|nr:hypothetical protein [Dehalococcoidia bacterium]
MVIPRETSAFEPGTHQVFLADDNPHPLEHSTNGRPCAARFTRRPVDLHRHRARADDVDDWPLLITHDQRYGLLRLDPARQ